MHIDEFNAQVDLPWLINRVKRLTTALDKIIIISNSGCAVDILARKALEGE